MLGGRRPSSRGPPHLSQELHPYRALGLSWLLKVFLGSAEFTNLDHEHNAWRSNKTRK